MCYVRCKEQCFACPVYYVTANRLAWSIYSGGEITFCLGNFCLSGKVSEYLLIPPMLRLCDCHELVRLIL